ncbi:MAG TPA: invasin domain 3-containing protein, partial [Symbiobacteriaceae bacterium]|nr:invasin domain 3-containing protein [Symbiobacteriaceae bacterium]
MKRRFQGAMAWAALLLTCSLLVQSIGVPSAAAAKVPAKRARTLSLTTITIDGNLSDWNSVGTYRTDPEDVNGATSEDLVKAWVTSDASNLYVRWDAKLRGQTTDIKSTLYGLAFSSSGGTTADAMAWVYFDQNGVMSVAVEDAAGTISVPLSNSYAIKSGTGTKLAVVTVEAKFPYTEIKKAFPTFDQNAYNALWWETHAAKNWTSNTKDWVPEPPAIMSYNPSTGDLQDGAPAPNLTISASAAPASARAGDPITYTVNLGNTGTADGTISDVTFTLPAGFTYQAGSATGLTTGDPSGSTGTLTWSGLSSTVTAKATQSLSFRATAAGTAGTYSSQATANSGSLTTGSTATVTVAANSAPTLTVPVTRTVKQNQTVTFTATATDPENDLPITFEVISGPGSITAGGSYSWTPDASTPLGAQPVVIRATDALGASTEKTVTITVTERDADLTLSTVTASPAEIQANGTDTSVVTVQLKDSNGVNLTQSHGTVVLTTTAGTLVGSVSNNGDGTYTQTLRAGNTSATATISATLDGQALTDTATVTFVASANGDPVITAPDTASGKQTDAITFDATATDPDGDAPLTFTIVTGTGTITTDGHYSWTPGAGTAPGTYEVVIRVSDPHGGTTEKTITITVTERDASLTLSTVTASPT